MELFQVQADRAEASGAHAPRNLRRFGLLARYQGFTELISDWEALKELYLQKSAGPAQLEVLSSLHSQLLQSAQRLWEQLQACWSIESEPNPLLKPS